MALKEFFIISIATLRPLNVTNLPKCYMFIKTSRKQEEDCLQQLAKFHF